MKKAFTKGVPHYYAPKDEDVDHEDAEQKGVLREEARVAPTEKVLQRGLGKEVEQGAFPELLVPSGLHHRRLPVRSGLLPDRTA